MKRHGKIPNLLWQYAGLADCYGIKSAQTIYGYCPRTRPKGEVLRRPLALIVILALRSGTSLATANHVITTGTGPGSGKGSRSDAALTQLCTASSATHMYLTQWKLLTKLRADYEARERNRFSISINTSLGWLHLAREYYRVRSRRSIHTLEMDPAS